MAKQPLENFNDEELRAELQRRVDLVPSPQPTDEATDLSELPPIAYQSLLTKLGKSAVFEEGKEPSQNELDEWYVWVKAVFMPLNDLREKVIIEKAYLIVEEEMPTCLLEFVTHVVGFKAVLAKWVLAIFQRNIHQSIIRLR
jgi:hypothetical protein